MNPTPTLPRRTPRCLVGWAPVCGHVGADSWGALVLALAVLFGDRTAQASEPPATATPTGSEQTEASSASAGSEQQPAPSREGDDFDLTATSRTYFQVYEQAYLPGPGGATVSTELMAPIHEYVHFYGDRLDTSWAKDSTGFELAGWASAQLAGDELTASPDGDVSVASVFHRLGPATFRLGRQVTTVGAARFARFDGLAVDYRSSSGFGASAYGGFTVLPRWSGRPAYHQLGSAFDTLVEDPAAYREPDRGGDWLGGGRVSYHHEGIGEIGVGFHEQRVGAELDRRNLSLDLLLQPVDVLDVTGRALWDADASKLADALLAVDLYPVDPLTVGFSYRHLAPQLLLSKQSIFSVFTTKPFDEFGAEVELEPVDRLELEAGQYVELLGFGDAGLHTQVGVRTYPDAGRRVAVQAAYGRVHEPDNGYHSARVSGRWHVAQPVFLVAEHYAYFYDEEIRGVSTSSVEAFNAEYAGDFPVRFLLGGTYAHTPYAVQDARVLLRVVYETHRQGAEL